jgi:uncharacterized membrane protein YphA (DoxX/SURF4 family)
LPLLSTTALSLGQTLGGVFLILGIFTVPVAVLLSCGMLGAMLFHLKAGEGWRGSERAVLLLAICVALAIAGGGAFQIG